MKVLQRSQYWGRSNGHQPKSKGESDATRYKGRVLPTVLTNFHKIRHIFFWFRFCATNIVVYTIINKHLVHFFWLEVLFSHTSKNLPPPPLRKYRSSACLVLSLFSSLHLPFLVANLTLSCRFPLPINRRFPPLHCAIPIISPPFKSITSPAKNPYILST